ncbi:MAG: hypothetical protein Q8R37_00145 [Nanoarchaeota archaeon]|nr:hypothetical protein [Nanoarchaeota archaeon]
MAKKVLIGVDHIPENVERTVQAIYNYAPSSVGLELPEDYEEREKLGLTVSFFDDIVCSLREDEIKVVYLENPEAIDYFRSVNLAKLIVEGHVSKEEIHCELLYLKKINVAYMSPETIFELIVQKKRYGEALDLVTHNDLDNIILLWEQTNHRREAHMKKNIKSYNPDVIVIGDAHAQEITTALPDYEYIAIK